MKTALVPFLAAAALLLPGCGTPGPLYSRGENPRLLDGEVRMTTRWTPGGPEDVREVRCKDGAITALYDGREGRFEGEADEAAWRKLWARLDAIAPWNASEIAVDPDDPDGGPYHVVGLRVGDDGRAFSAQTKGGLIQIGTRSSMARLEYSNAVVDFVKSYAKREVRKGPPPAASRPAEPPAPGGGKR